MIQESPTRNRPYGGFNTEAAQRMVSQSYDTARETVTAHPTPAFFSAFALGFGLGVALVLIAPAMEPQRLDESLRDKFMTWMKQNNPWG